MVQAILFTYHNKYTAFSLFYHHFHSIHTNGWKMSIMCYLLIIFLFQNLASYFLGHWQLPVSGWTFWVNPHLFPLNIKSTALFSIFVLSTLSYWPNHCTHFISSSINKLKLTDSSLKNSPIRNLCEKYILQKGTEKSHAHDHVKNKHWQCTGKPQCRLKSST